MLQAFSYSSSAGSPANGEFGNLLSGLHGWNPGSNESISIPLVNLNLLYLAFSTTAPGVGTSRTMTIVANGSDTAAVVTISNTATSGSWQGNVTLTAAQTVTIRHNLSGSPAAASQWKATFIVDTPTNFQSVYFSENGGLTSVNSPRYKNPFDNTPLNSTLTTAFGYVALAGDIKQYSIRATTTAVAQNHTFVLLKNGVVQDGTGGTVDTTFNWTPTAGTTTIGTSSTFTLPVFPGDTIQWRGTHASGGLSNLTHCLLFESSTVKKFTISKYISALTGTSNTTVYNSLGYESSANAWGAAGTVDLAFLAATKLNNFYAQLSAAPSAGKTRSLAIRVNGSNTALAFTISDANTIGSNTSDEITVDPASIDYAIATFGTGSPTTTAVYAAMVGEVKSSGGGGGKKGGNGPKGVGGKQLFGTTGMIFWDSINGFGQ